MVEVLQESVHYSFFCVLIDQHKKSTLDYDYPPLPNSNRTLGNLGHLGISHNKITCIQTYCIQRRKPLIDPLPLLYHQFRTHSRRGVRYTYPKVGGSGSWMENCVVTENCGHGRKGISKKQCVTRIIRKIIQVIVLKQHPMAMTVDRSSNLPGYGKRACAMEGDREK